MNWRLGLIFAIVFAVIFILINRGRSKRGPDGK